MAESRILTKGEDVAELASRVNAVSAMMNQIKELLPNGIARLEVDVEWPDGGRVKMEAKA